MAPEAELQISTPCHLHLSHWIRVGTKGGTSLAPSPKCLRISSYTLFSSWWMCRYSSIISSLFFYPRTITHPNYCPSVIVRALYLSTRISPSPMVIFPSELKVLAFIFSDGGGGISAGIYSIINPTYVGSGWGSFWDRSMNFVLLGRGTSSLPVFYVP